VEQGFCFSAGKMSRILPDMAVYIPGMTGYSWNNTGHLVLFDFEFEYSAILMECISIRCVLPPKNKDLHITVLNYGTMHARCLHHLHIHSL
jgi:hypothetical protein